jgi:hypothetical protein
VKSREWTEALRPKGCVDESYDVEEGGMQRWLERSMPQSGVCGHGDAMEVSGDTSPFFDANAASPDY